MNMVLCSQLIFGVGVCCTYGSFNARASLCGSLFRNNFFLVHYSIRFDIWVLVIFFFIVLDLF